MDVRLLYPSLFLKAHDLRGEDKVLTIRSVAVEELKTERGSEKKPILRFEETYAAAKKNGSADKEKRLVMNRTNAMTIASLYGYEVDEWKGKRITLYATKVQAFGELVDCLRIREEIPAAPAKEKS